MATKNTATFLTEKFKKEMPDGKITEIDGITVMIDGKIKQIFDIVINKLDNYDTYADVLQEAIFIGLDEITASIRKKD